MQASKGDSIRGGFIVGERKYRALFILELTRPFVFEARLLKAAPISHS